MTNLQPLLYSGRNITRIQLVKNRDLLTAFDLKISNLEYNRAANVLCNQNLPGDDPEKHKILQYLKTKFLETKLTHTNIMRLWHGCSSQACKAICAGGAKDLRRTDGGYFGSGIYLTPDCEYAANWYSAHYPPNKKGEMTLLLCLVVVGLTYPISRATDYIYAEEPKWWNICKYHSAFPISAEMIEKNNMEALNNRNDKALKNGFDSHFICVSENNGFQAVNVDGRKFSELVVKEETQVLPLGIVYFK